MNKLRRGKKKKKTFVCDWNTISTLQQNEREVGSKTYEVARRFNFCPLAWIRREDGGARKRHVHMPPRALVLGQTLRTHARAHARARARAHTHT